MTKIVLTRWDNNTGMKGKRVCLDKESVAEFYESDGFCTIYLRNTKSTDYLQVTETFDELRAIMEFEPEVADIFMKGKELS